MKSKIFLIAMLNIIIIIGALGVYQAIAIHRQDAEKIAKLQKTVKELQNGGVTAAGGTSGTSSAYKDGAYQGSAKGFGGNITVKVTVKGDKIKSIDIVNASGKDASYLTSAKSVIGEMLQNQITDVDTVSGATFSSSGIINAVIAALEKAER